MRLALACVASLALVGCYRSYGPAERDGGPPILERDAIVPPPRDAFVPPRPDTGPDTALRFRRCEGAFGAGSFGIEVECATATVPRVWDDPASGTISIDVERLPPPGGGRARSQIWMLNGGPGGSSLEFEVGYGPLVQSAIPDAEILLVDHRGVGSSDRLGCPEESPGSIAGEQISDEELAPCLDSVRARFTPAELAAFSTTNAARDVGELIERARRPGLPVFVYGASYGTYWAQRWLQLYPEQADGAILDSICSPGECRFLATQYDRSNDVGLDLLRMCADDAECRAHLGADPPAFALDVLRRLESGHCPELAARGIDRRVVQAIASSLLEEVQMRQAVPALFARVDRCGARDVEALFTLVDRLFVASPSRGGGTPASFAPVLYFLVTRSEMWELPTVDYMSLLARRREHLFYATPTEIQYLAWAEGPTYPRDELVDRYADTSIPMLMMNGTLDPQTPMADARGTAEQFVGPAQTFVAIDRAPHAVVSQAQYELGDPYRTCGLDLMAEFVRDPRAPLDTRCRTETSRIDFSDGFAASTAFGTDRMWDAVPPLGSVLGPRSERALERVRRALRERFPTIGAGSIRER